MVLESENSDMSFQVDFDEALGELDKNSVMIREYWRDLRASWQASENALRRTFFYILALAVSFMLLGTKAIGEVTFLGFKVTNLGLVGTLIPAVIAYLTYVVSISAAITINLASIHDKLAHHYWPKFYDANLELTVRPTGSLAETALVANAMEENILAKVAGLAGILRLLIYICAPVVFDVYAIWQSLAHHEGILWLNYVVTAFSFVMFLVSVPNFISVVKVIRDY
jgi:hypothetical protein